MTLTNFSDLKSGISGPSRVRNRVRIRSEARRGQVSSEGRGVGWPCSAKTSTDRNLQTKARDFRPPCTMVQGPKSPKSGEEVFQKNPRVRKIQCPQFWGRKWLRQFFFGHLEKKLSFCRKTCVRKIPPFKGGGGLGGGGPKVPILFLWARGFF